MDSTTIRSAVISTDESFRATLDEVLQRPGWDRAISLSLSISTPFAQMGDEHLGQLRSFNPELIFLDIEQDPVLGLKFAQFLAEQAPARRIVATGPMLSSDLLLHALRAGVAEYLPKPVTREALAPAVEAQLRRLRASSAGAPQQPGQLFAIFSPKGGSGSTTVATNLAIHLHRLTGKRTLLVDLDLELGEIALQLGVEPRFSFIDMVRNFHRMDSELLTSFIETHTSGVHLLSAPYHPERAELLSGDQITKILQFLKQHYEYLIVDTSKSFSPATLATFAQAEQIYLVTTVDLPSLRNITRCLPLLKQVSGGAEEKIRLVLNRHQASDPIDTADIERTLGLKVFWTIANDYEGVMRSINTGTPVILNGTSRYAHDLKALGAEIAGLRAGPAQPGGRFNRVIDPLSRLLKRNLLREAEAKA